MQPKSWEFNSQPKRQYPADEKLTLTLSTPWMQAYLGTIVCKFGGDPVVCLREKRYGGLLVEKSQKSPVRTHPSLRNRPRSG